MKKFYLSLFTIAALVSCNTINPNLRKTDLKILAPTGAPAVSMYKFANGLTTVTNPQLDLIPMFQQNTYDVIVAPAKGGLTQIIKKNANYKMAAVVTFGNFALVSTGNDADGVLNEGDKVLYFQPNDIPGSVFDYLYGGLGLETYSVEAANLTVNALKTGTYKLNETTTINLDYVFSAEPMITNAGKANKVYERSSEVFNAKTSGKKIIQAAVFVNNNSSEAKIDEFLTLLESDISSALSNANNLKTYMNLYGSSDEQKALYGFDSLTVYGCMKDYNGLGLGYIRAKEYKEDINYFINDILKGGLTIGEEVYF